MPNELPFWAQIGVGALGVLLLVVVLGIGAATKRFGTLWVFGWVYREKAREAEEWKSMALELMSTTSDVARVAQQNTTMTPEEAVETLRVLGIKSAEDARRAVIQAGDRNRAADVVQP